MYKYIIKIKKHFIIVKLKAIIKVNRCGNLFFNFDFQLVGASLSLFKKLNRDRKRYKNRKCEMIYRWNGHLAMLIFDIFCIKTPKNLTNLKNLTTSQKLTAKVKFEFLLFLLLLPYDYSIIALLGISWYCHFINKSQV